MSIPENQNRLIEAVAEVQSNIVVVLLNGSPVEMPWIDKVKSVLEAYLGGQALGGALADVLFGEVNPSGKLAETFPVKLSHNPSYLNFPERMTEWSIKKGCLSDTDIMIQRELSHCSPLVTDLAIPNLNTVIYQSIKRCFGQ